jgi:hypothetical protein
MDAAPWYQPLLDWSQAVGCSVQVVRYEAQDWRRRSGDWWKQGQSWCLHLDESVYARFSQTPEPLLRETLTWLVRGWSEQRQQTIRRWLEDQLRFWFSADDATLLAALQGIGQHAQPGVAALGNLNPAVAGGSIGMEAFGDAVDRAADEPSANRLDGTWPAAGSMPDRWPFQAECGRLVWMQAHGGGRLESGVEQCEQERGFIEIAREFAEDVELGWITLENGEHGAWLFWPCSSEQVALAPASDPAAPGAADTSTGGLRGALTQFLQALGADLFVAYEAAVGAEVCNLADLPYGMATMVLTWRRRRILRGPNRLYIWNERPLETFLATQTESAIQSFLNAIASDSGREALALPDDLALTLNGLVRANLNVSEAARLLYLHRNTLLHRIERIRELTGYDVRNFEDALTLWLAQTLQRR